MTVPELVKAASLALAAATNRTSDMAVTSDSAFLIRRHCPSSMELVYSLSRASATIKSWYDKSAAQTAVAQAARLSPETRAPNADHAVLATPTRTVQIRCVPSSSTSSLRSR